MSKHSDTPPKPRDATAPNACSLLRRCSFVPDAVSGVSVFGGVIDPQISSLVRQHSAQAEKMRCRMFHSTTACQFVLISSSCCAALLFFIVFVPVFFRLYSSCGRHYC